MDRTNCTGYLSQHASQSLSYLCQILLLIWFTAFLIMVADILLLRNAWLRARSRRTVHVRSATRPVNTQEWQVIGYIEEYRQQQDRREVVRFQNDAVENESDGTGMRREHIEEMGERNVGENLMEASLVNTRL